MSYYLHFLSLAYAIAQQGESRRAKTVVLASMPLLLLALSTLYALALTTDLALPYIYFPLSALVLGFSILAVNERLLKGHWEEVVALSRSRRLAGVTYCLVLLSTFYYVMLIVLRNA